MIDQKGGRRIQQGRGDHYIVFEGQPRGGRPKEKRHIPDNDTGFGQEPFQHGEMPDSVSCCQILNQL